MTDIHEAQRPGSATTAATTASEVNKTTTHSSPFDQFNISSTAVLDTIEKQRCPLCHRGCRFYCNKCVILVGCPENSVPQLKLPIKVDVIKHEQERDGKSTALHAKLLAPQDVEVYPFKSMPEYESVDRLLLLFPSPEAKQLSEIDPSSFDKLVVIDGTWDQASKMSKSDSPLQRMRRVTIAPHRTLFWRHQKKSSEYLATIEAIYYFLREYHETYLSRAPTLALTSPPSSSILSTGLESTSASGSTTRKDESSNTSDISTSGALSDTKAVPGVAISPHNELISTHHLGSYTGQFDDILWFYKYFYEVIQIYYRDRTDGKIFTLKHKKDYIQYDEDDQRRLKVAAAAAAFRPGQAGRRDDSVETPTMRSIDSQDSTPPVSDQGL